MTKKLRIAIADDDAFIRRYFQETLTDMGHDVVSMAENGLELIEHSRQKNPDLIISDIKMPEMGGIDAAIEISREQSVPIILVSAYHDPDMIKRVEASRIMGYLVKPVERADLETAIAIARGRFENIEVLQDEASRLREKLESRKVIDRAKAILIKHAELTGEEEALRRMEKRASDEKCKLVDVARMIIAAESARDLFKKSDS